MTRADIRASVEAHWRDTLPPYLFPSSKHTVLPGMDETTVHEAINAVWESAHRQIIDMIDRKAKAK